MNKLWKTAAAAVLLLFLLPRLEAQELSLSTNLLDYANLATLNMEASYGFARHWSLNAGMRYNPFEFASPQTGDVLRNRQQSYALGARYWPWHIYSGWWLAAKLQYQEFNTGGLRSPLTTEGDRYGSGLSGGYTYMLNSHLNMEFGLGLWGGYERYTEYACPVCGKIEGKGSRTFLRPNELLLSLRYVF